MPRDKTRIDGRECAVAEPAVGDCSSGTEMLGKARLRAAGTIRDDDATTIREAMVLAAVALNWQSCL